MYFYSNGRSKRFSCQLKVWRHGKYRNHAAVHCDVTVGYMFIHAFSVTRREIFMHMPDESRWQKRTSERWAEKEQRQFFFLSGHARLWSNRSEEEEKREHQPSSKLKHLRLYADFFYHLSCAIFTRTWCYRSQTAIFTRPLPRGCKRNILNNPYIPPKPQQPQRTERGMWKEW